MERGRPKSIRTTILLDQFKKIGNRPKMSMLKRKKHEKLLNVFFNKFYNLLRSFWYNNSDSYYNQVKELVLAELPQLFLSNYWPKKFIHKSDIKLYDEKKLKAQFSMISCKNLMKHFLCFSEALQKYGTLLSELPEERLESLFSYSCIEVHKPHNSKKLWKCLIMDLACTEKNSYEQKTNLELVFQYLNLDQDVGTYNQHLEESDQQWLTTEENSYNQELLSTLDSLEESKERVFENFDNFSISSTKENIEDIEISGDIEENLRFSNDEDIEGIENYSNN